MNRYGVFKFKECENELMKVIDMYNFSTIGFLFPQFGYENQQNTNNHCKFILNHKELFDNVFLKLFL